MWGVMMKNIFRWVRNAINSYNEIIIIVSVKKPISNLDSLKTEDLNISLGSFFKKKQLELSLEECIRNAGLKIKFPNVTSENKSYIR